MCPWGWWSHFRAVAGGWLRLLETLLLSSLKGALEAGLKDLMRGAERIPDWGSRGGAVFASKCILKVEYAKGAYIPGLEITRFAPEFRGFWKKMVFECNNSL